MLDIKLLRENPELVRDNLKKRRNPRYLQLLDELVERDTLWRQSLTRLNEFRHEKNVLTPEIARLKKEKKEAEAQIQLVRELSEKIEGLEREVAAYAGQTRDALLTLPNLLHESVPFGEDG